MTIVRAVDYDYPFWLNGFSKYWRAKWARPRTSQVSSDFGVDRWPVIETSIA